MILSPERKQEVNDLAGQLARKLSIRQGSFEVHVNKGKPTGIDRLDKSLKFSKNTD